MIDFIEEPTGTIMAIAILTRGKQAGRRITIVQWPATIGRDTNATIPLDDDRVSRIHARIKKRDRLYILEDLQSKNGTYLNGDKITNSVINSGDKILIGDSEIVFLTPESQVDVASEIMELEHYATIGELEDVGGPIDIAKADEPLNASNTLRLGAEIDIHVRSLPNELLSRVFEINSNILSSDNLKDFCDNTLKGLHSLNTNISRSAFFIWSVNSKRLMPTASRHTGKVSKFFFSKRTLEGVISRKQGFILASSSSKDTIVSRHRVVLPIVHHRQLLGVIHLEFDNIALLITPEIIGPLRFLIESLAPSIDAFILRQELDGYSAGMIEAMVATLEAKDTYTHGHSERVSRYSLAIAEEMNLDREVKRLLLMSSLCHDIGKIGIPDAILRKASLLNPDEYEEMKQHPSIGANIISHIPNAKRFLSGVKYHHEKWDGSGYPDGLTGEEIPFFGRIIAVADVFDAMVSGRSYSGFMDEFDAVQKLNDEVELFDPDVVAAFTRACHSGRLTLKTSTQKNNLPTEDSGSDTE